MKRFDELGIVPVNDRKMFDVKQVSISDIINCEIEVVDYISDVKTKHGDGRCLILYKLNSTEGKFFSNAKIIKETLVAIPETDFPFITTIKCIKCGTNQIYKFT